ncbi:MAG TPA: lysylphosphatidylglycerol synthase transmembrane domain-containing protein [Thermoanaerobaculia bacterium]
MLFAAIFSYIGWPAIRGNLAAIGYWFPAIAVLYLMPQLAFTLGWWETIDPRPPLSFFSRLFGVYLAGDTVNYLGPANVAGEPLKAVLLKDEIAPERSVASLTVHKHADMLAQLAFAAGGFAVALSLYDLPRAAVLAAAVGVGGLAALFAVLTWALWRGTFSPVMRRLSGIAVLEARLSRYQGAASEIDHSIRAFYSRHPGRFARAVGWSLLGWCGGFVETAIVLALLRGRVDLPTAFVIEALAMVMNNLLSWMPGRVGTAEGVRVGLCVLLGLTPAQGAAYALVRRGRELLWAAPGGLVLLFGSPAASAEIP